MPDEKDVLPSDAEDGGLKPKPSPPDNKSPRPEQDDEKTEKDPSEQPS